MIQRTFLSWEATSFVVGHPIPENRRSFDSIRRFNDFLRPAPSVENGGGSRAKEEHGTRALVLEGECGGELMEL